jgi:phosphoribosyl-ATP pyrophosphohydrolase
MSDVFYRFLVLLAAHGLMLAGVEAELVRRRG